MLNATLDWIKQQKSHCIQQLIAWSDINSGSTNIQGLAAMHQALLSAYSSLADTCQTITCDPSGGQALFCQKRPELSRRILLCGHMDTVFPASSSFQTTHYATPNRLIGPGVADMKGGLVVMLTALQAFEQTPHAKKLGWDVFINADEELGSLASRNALDTIAGQSRIGLVFEPTLNEMGTLARARKGCGHFTLNAQGKAAHAGRDFHAGKNAIMLLARALTEIDALNSVNAAYSINVGLINGGEVLNQVPAYANAKLEIRINDPKYQTWIIEKLQQICQTHSRIDATLTLTGQFHRPVKTISPKTTRLFNLLQQAATTLHLQREWQDTGGCCDGNNLAALGLAVLDTLGVCGGAIHTENEYICLDSLTEQASLTCLLLHKLATGAFDEVIK